MEKQGDKFLQELRDKADARDRKRELFKILCLPKFKIGEDSLYVILKSERN